VKLEKNRISLTLNEADEIREYLETLYAMEGTLDESFNAECRRAGFFARKLHRLLKGDAPVTWPDPGPIPNRFDIL